MVQIGIVVSEKIQFEFLYVHNPGPRSRNDLDLQYSHIFIYSIRCLLLLTFRSLAAIVSEKSTVFTFSHRKAEVTKGQGSGKVKFGPVAEIYEFSVCYRIIYLMVKSAFFTYLTLKLCDSGGDKQGYPPASLQRSFSSFTALCNVKDVASMRKHFMTHYT